MIRAEGLLPYGQRALVERLGLRVLALCVVQPRQIVQARGHIGMIRAEGLLPDRQRALVERLGLRVLALLPCTVPPDCSGSWPHRDDPGPRPSPMIASERL